MNSYLDETVRLLLSRPLHAEDAETIAMRNGYRTMLIFNGVRHFRRQTVRITSSSAARRVSEQASLA